MHGIFHHFDQITSPKLFADACPVLFNCFGTQIETFGDLLGAAPGDQQSKNLLLPFAQQVIAARFIRSILAIAQIRLKDLFFDPLAQKILAVMDGPDGLDQFGDG